MKRLMLLLLLLGLAVPAFTQTWTAAKSCSVQSATVLRTWEDYFHDNGGSMILSSANHQSYHYASCFFNITMGYWVTGPNGTGEGISFQYLIEVYPNGGWDYVATYNTGSFGCSVGSGKSAVAVPCTDAYLVILDRMGG